MAANRRLAIEALPAEIVPAEAGAAIKPPGLRQPETVWVVGEEPLLPAGGAPFSGLPAMEVCDALGSTLDAGTSLGFASLGNRCLLSGAAEPVDLDHQARYCLGEGHRDCPHRLQKQARQYIPQWDTAEEAGEQPELVQPGGWRARVGRWAGQVRARLRKEEAAPGWYPADDSE